jgi:hypothetical protein
MNKYAQQGFLDAYRYYFGAEKCAGILTGVRLPPKFDSAVEAWESLGRETDPGAVARRYSRVGHEMVNMPFEHHGKKYIGKDIIYGVRKGKLGKIITNRFGKFNEGSQQHYDAFQKSPTAAYRQLFLERGYTDESLYRNLDLQKGIRYQAITQSPRRTPQEVARAVTDILTKQQKLSPSESAYIYQAALRDEARLARVSPGEYYRYLRTAAKVPSNPSKYNPLQRQMEDALFSRSSLAKQDLRTAAKRALGSRSSLPQAIIERDIYRNLKSTARGGYGPLLQAVKLMGKI